MFINYKESIVGIPNSILKYFGLKAINDSNFEIDEILLRNQPKNVILILCDGMGMNLLKTYSKSCPLLFSNIKKTLYSVFPTTTTAATTSIITGLYPNQHCWLGWDNYIKPIDKVVTLFLNTEKDTKNLFPENIGMKYFPYTTIFDLINAQTIFNATYLSPYAGTHYNGLDDMCEKIIQLCDNDERNFIYAYYENPDSIIHKTGTESFETQENLKLIEKTIKYLYNSLNDSLILITADHGLTNSSYIYLEDYPNLFNCLSQTTSIDSRACMLFIKEDKIDYFKNEFEKQFGSNFILLKQEDILSLQLFGLGINHNMFKSCLGNFIAIAISDKNLKYRRYGKELLSNHSGLTENEYLVPLITLTRKKKN